MRLLALLLTIPVPLAAQAGEPASLLTGDDDAVLDTDGRVVHRQVGLGVGPAASIASLRRLLD